MPSDASNSLTAILHSEINEHGAIPVSRWMEVALYHPEFGYYRKERDPFGVRGDFYTAEQLDPFAEMLATAVARLADVPGCRDEFSILELGAGRRDLRHALSAWNYVGHDFDQPPLPENVCGLVLAHEFFDAQPVRLLRKDRDGWKELAVTNGGGRFRIAAAPWSMEAELITYAQTYGSELPIGSVLEMNEGLARWTADIGWRLRTGTLLVFDYGYMAGELARLLDGTLMSYRRHLALDDILDSPGDRDITAHVNFSALIAQAELNGLQLESNLTLRQWALHVWNKEELERRWSIADMRWRMQWKQLVFGMGDAFRVLHFVKEAANGCP